MKSSPNLSQKGQKVFIKENSWVAKLAAFKLNSDCCAIVFFNTIYLHNISKKELVSNKYLLNHELMHVLQWKREGAVLFIIKYIWYSLKKGYYLNPFEQEARLAEADTEISKSFKIV